MQCGQTQIKLGQIEREYMQSSVNNFVNPLHSFLDGDMKTIMVMYISYNTYGWLCWLYTEYLYRCFCLEWLQSNYRGTPGGCLFSRARETGLLKSDAAE